jgi:hypothetical protein
MGRAHQGATRSMGLYRLARSQPRRCSREGRNKYPTGALKACTSRVKGHDAKSDMAIKRTSPGSTPSSLGAQNRIRCLVTWLPPPPASPCLTVPDRSRATSTESDDQTPEVRSSRIRAPPTPNPAPRLMGVTGPRNLSQGHFFITVERSTVLPGGDRRVLQSQRPCSFLPRAPARCSKRRRVRCHLFGMRQQGPVTAANLLVTAVDQGCPLRAQTQESSCHRERQ